MTIPYVAPTLVDGNPYSAAAVWNPALQEIERLSANLGDDAWSDYSSAFDLTASVADPTLGATTVSAWSLTVRRKMVTVRLQIDIGAGFAAGNGTYRFSLPQDAAAGAVMSSVGSVLLMDSGTAFRSGIAIVMDPTYFEIYADGVGGGLGSGGPGTAWAAGDRISATISFEPDA